MLQNGEIVIIEMVQHEILEKPVKVYNFEVQDFHTYFVSSINVLVHNSCSRSSSKPLEIKSSSQIRASKATDCWDEFLGDNPTDTNPNTGNYSPDRIFSEDGSRSIRFSSHEMDSMDTSNFHFHYEWWESGASEPWLNFLQRIIP